MLIKRLHAHLQIQDDQTACEEAIQSRIKYPLNRLILEAHIQALAHSGQEKKMWLAWQTYIKSFPEAIKNREILECLAWSVIETGSNSSSSIVRLMALIGAYFGQDAKGVAIICKNMRDSNSLIRTVALKLGADLKDASLQKEVINRLQNDKNWHVRLAALNAIGQMKIRKAEKLLLQILANPTTAIEEKTGAIEAIVEMTEQASRTDIEDLINKGRAPLRLLACELIEKLDLLRDRDLLFGLLNDYQAEVRLQALQTIGLLRLSLEESKCDQEAIDLALQDRHPKVAIAAAWVLTLNNHQEGLKALTKWLYDSEQEIRLYAAGALIASGKYGLPLIKKTVEETNDPYVRLNLALGLINQRQEVFKACTILNHQLNTQPEKWMWSEEQLFKCIVPSQVKQNEIINNYPETINQLVRLELLNILALMKYPEVEKSIKHFLQEKNWGVSGMATVVLLTEGDENAIAIIENLLQDSEPKVRIQAALILALWGRGEKAVTVLKDSYRQASRETKERILEGLGKIGMSSTIPFLVEKMQEPYQSLRILAAAGLLQCLYN